MSKWNHLLEMSDEQIERLRRAAASGDPGAIASYERALQGSGRGGEIEAQRPYVTRQNVERLGHGQVLYHIRDRNRDGSPARWRVNGRVKLWKTRPDEFQVPIKHGMYDFDYITQLNGNEFFFREEDVPGAL